MVLKSLLTLETQLADLELLAGQIRGLLQEWKGRTHLLRSRQLTHKTDADEYRQQAELHEKALGILQELEGTWRGKYEDALAALGSQGLSSIWGDERQVVLESTIKRGIAHLDLALVKDGKRVRLKGGSGGSVSQVLAVVLRMLITLSNRDWRLLFVLDEPFSQVAEEQRPALNEMIRGLRECLGFQLLFVSHEGELAECADIAYHIRGDGRGTADCLKAPGEEQT